MTINGVENPRGGVVGLGWSDVSEHEARRVAVERAKRAAARLREDEDPTGDGYPYPDRPIREPIIDRFLSGDRLTAVITRNSYGVLVLNTAEVMFIDIDAPISVAGCLAAMFGIGNRDEAHVKQTTKRLKRSAERDKMTGFRLYRTAAGLRVLVTGRAYEPGSDASVELMHGLHADKRYIQLCKVQSCYRARLTPKPWRCGVPRAPGGFPYERDGDQEAFEAWRVEYENAATGYAVCELIEQIGQPRVDSGVQPILTMHDEVTCRQGLPLA